MVQPIRVARRGWEQNCLQAKMLPEMHSTLEQNLESGKRSNSQSSILDVIATGQAFKTTIPTQHAFQSFTYSSATESGL